MTIKNAYVPQEGDVVIDQVGDILSRRGDHWIEGGYAIGVLRTLSSGAVGGDDWFELPVIADADVSPPLTLLVRYIDAGRRNVEIPSAFKPVQLLGDTRQKCRVCGCIDDDCSQCIAWLGEPCSWVEPDLCSACASVGGQNA